MSKKENNDKKLVWKDWRLWFGIVIIALFIGVFSFGKSIKDYTNQDAKVAYEELTSEGYSVRFLFDRNNNGGLSEEEFQKYVVDDSFGSESYKDMPFIVSKQKNDGKTVTLSIEYKSVIDAENKQSAMEEKLEEKLNVASALTACEQYGGRNYGNFKIHTILGQIAQNASDENTWFLKYSVDAGGFTDLNMECYVTGTTDNPQVTSFVVY